VGIDRGNNTRAVTSVAMIGVFLASVLIFPLLAIYLGNLDQFAVPLVPVLVLPLLVLVLVMCAAMLVLTLLADDVQRRVAAFFAGLSVLCWVQGNLLVWDYGLLNGRNIDWGQFGTEFAIDTAVWLVAGVLLVVLARRNQRLLTQLALTLFTVQLLACAVAVFNASPQLWTDTHARSSSGPGTLAGFSQEQNVLHFVTDGFQSDVFEELINSAEFGDSYHEGFSGFTYYRETLGAFPYTRFAVPAFLSGKLYSNETAKNEYIDAVLAGTTIISKARENGFEIDVVADGDYLIQRYSHLPYDQIFDIGDLADTNGPWQISAQLLDLSIFRVTPGPAKRYVYRDQKWLLLALATDQEALRFKYFTNTYFLRQFGDQMRVDRSAPSYKYIHIMNTHDPMVVNAGCEYAGIAAPSSRGSLTNQSRCTMDTLADIFWKMKQLGIYDNTTILIHADHGGWVGNYRKGPPVKLLDGNLGGEWVKSLASPLLAIKPAGASGPILTSDVQASLLDIPRSLSQIMGWENQFDHASVVSLPEDGVRERYFRFYLWQKNAWSTEYTGPIVEYSINGSHYETEWKRARVFNAPGS